MKQKVISESEVSRKRVWITWENQRRNISVSKVLGAELFQFDLKLNPFMRYLVALMKTIGVFVKKQPAIIFVQNPSLILAYFSTHYGRALNIPVVVDAHNAGLFPFDGKKGWANKMALTVLKNATLTLVTNEALKNYVVQKGGRAFVLADPLPEFPSVPEKKKLKGKYNVLFICTYASDEPYIEVIKAARELDKEVVLYITGKSKGKEKEFDHLLSENVVLTGFLPEHDFIQMLHSVDIVIDLTTREDCLVCGAYEAVVAGKPMILSNTKALKTYFSKGAFYVDNTSKDLVTKINDAIHHLDKLKKEIKELKKEKIEEGISKREMIEEYLKEIKNSSS